MFCQQDRAILCKECDLPIHSANDHTKKHSRFLLTGTKLSATAATPHPSPPSNPKTQSSSKNPVLVDSCNASQPIVVAKNNISPSTVPAPPTSNNKGAGSVGGSLVANEEASGFTSSISEYLTKTIPGWQVEDFLDSPSVPFGFSKVCNMILNYAAVPFGFIWVHLNLRFLILSGW